MSGEPLTPGQVFALRKLVATATGRDSRSDAARHVLRRLTGKEDYGLLSVEDWRKVRDRAYPRWYQEDWSLYPGFRDTCRQMVRGFEREELGQQELF